MGANMDVSPTPVVSNGGGLLGSLGGRRSATRSGREHEPAARENACMRVILEVSKTERMKRSWVIHDKGQLGLRGPESLPACALTPRNQAVPSHVDTS